MLLLRRNAGQFDRVLISSCQSCVLVAPHQHNAAPGDPSSADFTPADIDTTAYRVFLGQNQYFVTSDVGEGKTQW